MSGMVCHDPWHQHPNPFGCPQCKAKINHDRSTYYEGNIELLGLWDIPLTSKEIELIHSGVPAHTIQPDHYLLE